MKHLAAALLVSLLTPGLPGLTQSHASRKQHGGGSGAVTWKSCEAGHPRFSGHSAPFSGVWYLYQGSYNEEIWEFWGDSMFRHTWIAGRSGTGARTSERGRFAVKGGRITLHITSETQAVLAPTRTGGGAAGGTRCKDETRELSFKMLGRRGAGGLILDGIRLRFRSR